MDEKVFLSLLEEGGGFMPFLDLTNCHCAVAINAVTHCLIYQQRSTRYEEVDELPSIDLIESSCFSGGRDDDRLPSYNLYIFIWKHDHIFNYHPSTRSCRLKVALCFPWNVDHSHKCYVSAIVDALCCCCYYEKWDKQERENHSNWNIPIANFTLNVTLVRFFPYCWIKVSVVAYP